MVMLYKLTKKHTLWLLLILVIYINATVDYKTYIVVAKDGSGDFTAIQEAVTSCKSFPDKRITIFVKNGIYKEKVVIPSWNSNIKMIGEDVSKTIITYDDRAWEERNSTFKTYTLKICGNDFILENITVENSAGQVG